MTQRFTDVDGMELVVKRTGNRATVRRGSGWHMMEGQLECSIRETGTGFVVRFEPSYTNDEYYLCFDHAQARQLVLALSEFKHELRFETSERQ